MILYIAKRIAGMIPILWIITTCAFFLMRFAPGGPFDSEKPIDAVVLKNLEAKYHFDKPLLDQYVTYLGNVIQGDFGPSFKYKDQTVNDIIAASFPISVELGCYALLFAVLFGIFLGCIAAYRRNSWVDWLLSSISIFGMSIPNMVLGPVLVVVVSIKFGWLPTSGWHGPSSKILPSLTLGLTYFAIIMRLMRAGLLDVLSTDYIRTARSKGLRTRTILFHHALRGSLIPVISFLGPAVAFVITGSVVVEQIFHIPGMGRYFVSGALNRDYTTVLGVTILLSALVLVMNLVVDVLYHILDPRIRMEKPKA